MNQNHDGKQPQAGDEWSDPATGMVFVWIPAGRFIMGSNTTHIAEYPAHEVEISHGFWLGKYPVTQAEWQRLMGANPSHFSQFGSDWPVEQVSWMDAQEFIRKLNARSRGLFRLPTEAEWEYACRAGHTGDYGFECGKEKLPDYAWFNRFNDEDSQSTLGVGRKLPNDWGLYDMLGNVQEWVGDRYDNYTHDRWIDPTGPESPTGGRVTRGGCFNYGDSTLRSTLRDFLPEHFKWPDVGFRVLRQSDTAPTALSPRRTIAPDPALTEIVAGPRPAPGNKPGKEWIEPVTGMAFVWVPPGRFFMGLEHWQDKLYRVNLTRGFWLGKHPVTEQQWHRLMSGLPRWGDPKTRHLGCPSSFDDYPINYLGWWDAKRYIDTMNRYCGGGFRFPTEAEWAFACRANPVSEGAFSPEAIKEMRSRMRKQEFFRYLGFGHAKYLEELKERARWGYDELGTWPVGQRKPNDWGFHDMLGLVEEWVQDWHSDELPDTVTNPTGPEIAGTACHKVLRGSYNRERMPTPSVRGSEACWPYGGGGVGNGFRVAREC